MQRILSQISCVVVPSYQSLEMTIPSQEEPVITFEKPTYAPGEVVMGKVIFTLKDRLPLSAWLVFIGEERSRKRYTNSIRTEPIFYGTTSVWSDEDFSAGFGVYSVPFCFQLPRDIPDSRLFNDGDALREIRYFVKFNSEYQEPDDCIMMIRRMNLFRVRHPELLPQVATISKSIPFGSSGCCFGKRSQITGQLSLDKGAYFPGETVKFRGVFSQTTAGLIQRIKAEFGYKLHENDHTDLWLSVDSRTLSKPAISLKPTSIEPTVVEFEVTIPDETVLSERRCYFINLEVVSTGGLMPFNIYVDVHSDELAEVVTVDPSIPVTNLAIADFKWFPL